jgi:hypothetical protein
MSSAQSASLAHESGEQYCVVPLHGVHSLSPGAQAMAGQATFSVAHS